ncbi:S8 family peptidase [uncultured Piscinibacter sp.]|uniref:S8 family peptidase n=1 Tax=uncultured Piscinibacter sp. TaxID=1131835 RepID=UPI0026322C5F|nr:S8 family peptidase [uncultured Piscinibacter sp.]
MRRSSIQSRRWAMPLASVASALLVACGGGGSADADRSAPQAANRGEAISKAIAAQTDIASGRATNRLYIVQLVEDPVVAYEGGIAGYRATKPAQGRKIDSTNPDVVNYFGYLSGRHDALLASVGGGRKAYSYGFVFNGFAAELSEAQAAKLATTAGVLSVSRDERRRLETSDTPSFLGLAGPGGLWERTGVKGEGVVIGIVDSGIWPEHASLSDRTDVNGNGTRDGKLGYQQIPGWNGRCTPGEQFTASNCNQKLIGARYYNEGFGGNAGVRAELPYEFLSPRDFDGHGTHTATTAGGNQNVATSGPASVFGAISGIAPRARIAAYKVCWGTGDEGGCFNSDSVAAIDQAVADGVDVINFSISGSLTNFLDPVELAFLFAADAGVFVAASAGNSGPASATVAHPGPWLTTVAAGTHPRDGRGSVTLGNGVTYQGASIAQALPSSPLIAASDAALPGADPAAVALCFAAIDTGGTAVLDPAKVNGKIVVCDRGVTARVNKSLAVKQAGGVGMILANTSVSSLNADFHEVPTVHVQSTDRAAIYAYAATAGATAEINAATIVFDAVAPLTATFSSRGPLRAGGGDLLKPDLIAPGQDILAGVSPMGHGGKLFDLLSGTSMSSPHVAGLAALFKQAKPGWSPMAIKSALMTTAYDVLDGGTPAPNTNPVLIFRQGAGHVSPNAALDPGLVFDHSWNDWLAFLCGTTSGVGPATCNALRNAGYSTDASDLNGASIAIGDMAGVQTVKRRVTNVGAVKATYTASVTGMGGFAVTPPAPFEILPGETKTITLSFLRTAAALNNYTGGQFTLSDGAGHVVRVPMVVRPVALAAPAQVSSNGAATSYGLTFGYDGPFSATARGLVPAAISAGNVADDPSNGACSLSSPNAQLIPVVVPPGTSYARFSLFDADVSAGADIDLCVFNNAGQQVGASGSGTSAEEVNLSNPAAGNYTVVVQGWGVVGSSPFKLHTWLLGVADAGNMTVSAPPAATIGATGTVSLNFTGLAAATKYLGAVAYGGAGGLPSPTIVRVDTP